MKSQFLAAPANEAFMLPCLNKQVFGIECPGCGLQRAFWMLVEGDIMGAFWMYPGLFPLLSLLGFIIADRLLNIRHSGRILAILAILTTGTILTNYIIKLL